MISPPKLALLALCVHLLLGCSSRAGCQGDACERAESGPGRLVIWWVPSLRAGLGDPEHPVDHSIIELDN